MCHSGTTQCDFILGYGDLCWSAPSVVLWIIDELRRGAVMVYETLAPNRHMRDI